MMQIEVIKEEYKPADATNVTETLMAIAELYGDVTYKCPTQEIAQVFPFKQQECIPVGCVPAARTLLPGRGYAQRK